MMTSDSSTMLRACVAGVGIAQILALGTRDLIEQGRLIELFPDWPGEVFPYYALYPSRHQRAAKVRAFIDFVVEALSGHRA